MRLGIDGGRTRGLCGAAIGKGWMCAAVSAFGIALAPVGAAEGARIVRAGGDANFIDIQSAVNAAVDGDVILVAEGTYPDLIVANKSVSIVAFPGAQVNIDGMIQVANLSQHQVTTIAGLSVASNDRALWMTHNDGYVAFRDCRFEPGLGYQGARLEASADVVFVGCDFLGGAAYIDSGDGANALDLVDSRASLFHCELRGGDGGWGMEMGGWGGDACYVQGGWLFAAGSTFHGGDGGDGGDCGGDGGNGIYVPSGQAHLLDVIAQGGYGGPPNGYDGCNTCPTGAVIVTLAGTARKLVARRAASDRAVHLIDVEGEAGDRVFVLSAARPDFFYLPALRGVWVLPAPPWFNVLPIGSVGPSGQATLALPVDNLPRSEIGALRWYQGLVLDAQGEVRLGSPFQVAVVNWTSSPDCNGNLVQDYAEIIEGTAVDTNANLIPDDCETQGGIWYVDAGAPPGGNGSQTMPFQTIAEGIAHAAPGHEVVIADGFYVGPNNRDLAPNVDIVVRSANGPANCIIDCGYASRAFEVGPGLTSATRIEGLTIRRGKGGIVVDSGDPTIASCRFEQCSDTNFSAILLEASSSLIDDCVFVGNVSNQGGAIEARDGPIRIRSCWFENNEAGKGGAVYARWNLGSPQQSVITHSVFLGNLATSNFGGAVDVNVIGSLLIGESLFAGNTADFGGGALAGFVDAEIRDSVFVANTAGQHGGALALNGFDYEFSNTILWSNVATVGAQASLDQGATLSVRYSDVEAGQAGIDVGAGATLVWQAGNIDADPLFADPDGPDNDPATYFDNDYRLGAGSPCLDAADSFAMPRDVLDIDGDGNKGEFVGLDLDLGLRFVDDPGAPNTGAGLPVYLDMGPYERVP